MNSKFASRISAELEEIQSAGLFKNERIISSEQGAEIIVNGKTVLNFCANNYLGLSSHPKVIEAAKKYIDYRGYGLSSVRFICGTQDIHKELENKIATFLGTEDTILYAAAFDANGGVFEPLFNEEDAIISDALNHASIIDGVRLCKAQRFRYEHNNMNDLEAKLKESAHLRSRIIVTDGSFSMDGTIAQLDKICDLADQYDAIVMIDECHSSGFLGKTGRGTHEYFFPAILLELQYWSLLPVFYHSLPGYCFRANYRVLSAALSYHFSLLQHSSRPCYYSWTVEHHPLLPLFF